MSQLNETTENMSIILTTATVNGCIIERMWYQVCHRENVLLGVSDRGCAIACVIERTYCQGCQ